MSMVQYSVWPNCSNNCKFCLRTDRIPISIEAQFKKLEKIQENLKYVDWKNKFKHGISLLGGELYYITDASLQNKFFELIDDIIEIVLKPNKLAKYSTVTNGLYNPEFLYKIIDKIVNATGIERIDLNFSYDLKYRFSSSKASNLVLNNINEFHKKYNYNVGVQMILTQYLIDLIKNGDFNITNFETNIIPGNTLCLLYPHPIHTGLKLDDFNFKRKDFLNFCINLKTTNPQTLENFIASTINSSKFKYSGLLMPNENTTQTPELSIDKTNKNIKCGHSKLYQCYSDCDNCMLCDILNFY
jgi:hypothetical protein